MPAFHKLGPFNRKRFQMENECNCDVETVYAKICHRLPAKYRRKSQYSHESQNKMAALLASNCTQIKTNEEHDEETTDFHPLDLVYDPRISTNYTRFKEALCNRAKLDTEVQETEVNSLEEDCDKMATIGIQCLTENNDAYSSDDEVPIKPEFKMASPTNDISEAEVDIQEKTSPKAPIEVRQCTDVDIMMMESHRKNGFLHCDKCDYKTNRKTNLERHKVSIHTRRTKSYECCGLTFLERGLFRSHEKKFHNVGYTCDKCHKKFSKKASFNRHKIVHSGTKPFSCHFCSYRSGHKSNIERHNKTHNKERIIMSMARRRIEAAMLNTNQSRHDYTSISRLLRMSKNTNEVSNFKPVPHQSCKNRLEMELPVDLSNKSC